MRNYVVGDNLAKKLALSLKWPYLAVQERVFLDGELQPKLAFEPKIKKAILLYQKKTGENINSYLVKYLFLARKLQDLSKEIIGIMPYFPYMRQDSIFREGEPLSSLYIAELLSKYLDVFITVGAHEHRKHLYDLFKIPSYNVVPYGVLGDYLKKVLPNDTKKMIVVGPDQEAANYVKAFCSTFPLPYIVLQKQRHIKTGKIKFAALPNTLFQDKIAIIVDDIVSSGGTISEVGKLIKRQGASKIIFAFIHTILGDQSVRSLQKLKPFKIITTNTIENSFYSIEITKLLTKTVKELI
ncbi:MAG: Ribose-phosphate pyrophosphokinase [Parcubacteria group bacterium ADurb.Bin305]|jgi:ribose-phosphate pyrophosphokinase|nr:ribose-phosphate diphosphokinase [Candidatus Paceibacterota bacterium]MDD3434361.1 ribose-phosphate diphosphokinase [Candidatus Paceibacterota bacterium]OQA43698.1 MAG: Ribose-phosphate pyrophosphokinase [Parcubacteria group bacterium ADurb.Bin305]